MCGARELQFFSGTAVGSVAPGFRYETEAGAAALGVQFTRKLTWCGDGENSGGGGGSGGGDGGGSDGGNGQEAIEEVCLLFCRDACACCWCCFVWLLLYAMYHALSHTLSPPYPPPPPPTLFLKQCVDYVNGGPAFVPPPPPPPPPPSAPNTTPATPHHPKPWAPVAWYADTGALAAVCCKVGNGRAVLCGSHPELLPDWLTPATQADALVSSGMAGEDAAHLAAHAAAVQVVWCWWLQCVIMGNITVIICRTHRRR